MKRIQKGSEGEPTGGGPKVADSLSQWIPQLLIELDSARWIEFRGAYIPESDLASHMAWDKVDVILERMPENGLKAIKLIKDELKLDMGIGELFAKAKKAPATLMTGTYYAHAQPAVAKLADVLNENCISIYPEHERESPLPEIR